MDKLKKKPSRVIITLAVILAAVLSIILIVNKLVKALELPSSDSVFSVEMEQLNDVTSIGQVTLKDTNSINAVLSALSGANKTMWPSVNDYPTANSYLIIRLNLEGQQRTFCLYTEGNSYYIEEPYIGIYKSSKSVIESLYKIYTTSLNQSFRTYYLENPTEKQKLERLISVTLYSDGTVKLATPLISSYILPKCTYSMVGDELLIRAIIESSFDEGFYGVKNGDIIARFAIEDEALIFKSAAVPLFADAGARYVYTPFSSSAYEIREWLNYLYDEQMPWESSLELQLPEYPDTVFRWTPYEVKAVDSDGEKILLTGMPVWNVYLADLTDDGLPEFCATVSFGSGIVDQRIIVYDYAANKTYDLNDRSHYDYILYLDNGQLMVKQTRYLDPKSTAVATGELAIVGGKLTAAGIDRTITNPSNILLSSWMPLADLPADYSKEQAVADSVYVNIHGTEIYNQNMVDIFYESVFSVSEAFMRVMQYTIEGDPVITDYQFDGNIFTVTHDSTRDKYMASDDRIISAATYKYLVPLYRSHPVRIPQIYYLSNKQNIFTETEDGEGAPLIDGLWQMPSPSANVDTR